MAGYIGSWGKRSGCGYRLQERQGSPVMPPRAFVGICAKTAQATAELRLQYRRRAAATATSAAVGAVISGGAGGLAPDPAGPPAGASAPAPGRVRAAPRPQGAAAAALVNSLVIPRVNFAAMNVGEMELDFAMMEFDSAPRDVRSGRFFVHV